MRNPPAGRVLEWVGAALVIAALVLALGCGERSRARSARHAGVGVFADSARAARLEVRPPPIDVSPSAREQGPAPAVAIAPARGDETPPPAMLPGELPAAGEQTPDPAFKPPILRTAPALRRPAGAGGGLVTLDLRVEPDGSVGEVRWAGGSADPVAVRAARECAFGMRFYAARRAGEPVSAWCRRRFEF